MQRRRKKKAAAAAKKPAHLDKSLPSLPVEEPELPPVAHDPSKHHHGRDGVPDTTSRSHSPERRVPPPQPTHPAPSPPVRQPDNSAGQCARLVWQNFPVLTSALYVQTP